MSDLGSKAALQADIDAKVTSNGNSENTGTRVRAALTNMVDTLSNAGNLSPAPFIYVTAGSNATGVYQKVGTANGKNWYRKVGAIGPADPDNPTSAVIYIDGWYVTDENTDPLYFSASDVATPDLATGWDNTPPSLTGEAPLPSIAGYPGPTVQDVLEQIAARVVPVLTGNTLWVDAVYGNDSTGLANRQDKPFLTLNAAQDAAVAGDTVRVRPGSYIISTTIAKDEVNWHFDVGASVNMTTDTNGSIFDDEGTAMSFTVSGCGVFTRGETIQPEEYANVIHMSNAGSVITIYCDQIINTANEESGDVGSSGTSAIFHENGVLNLTCRHIEAQSYAYYWKEGPAWITADSIVSNGNTSGDGDAILCRPPSGNAEEVFIRAQFIKSSLKSAVYSSLAESPAPLFRLWVIAESISGGIHAIQHGSGKVYVTAQKLSVSLDNGIVIQSGDDSGTELYVNAQKVGSSDSLTSVSSGFHFAFCGLAKTRINVMEYDASSITSWSASTPLFSVSSTGALNTVITGGVVRTPSAITTPIISNSISSGGGTRRFVDMILDNSAAGGGASAPVVLFDDITILSGCTIITAASSSIDAPTAQTVVSYGSYANTAVDGNVTVDGLLTVGAYVS